MAIGPCAAALRRGGREGTETSTRFALDETEKGGAALLERFYKPQKKADLTVRGVQKIGVMAGGTQAKADIANQWFRSLHSICQHWGTDVVCFRGEGKRKEIKRALYNPPPHC